MQAVVLYLTGDDTTRTFRTDGALLVFTLGVNGGEVSR